MGIPLNKGRFALLYADDRNPVQYADVDGKATSNFRMCRRIATSCGKRWGRHRADSEARIQQQFHRGEDAADYGEVEIPLTVQADISTLELAAPDARVAKTAAQ